ncbi:MAG: hypothetical protein K2R93_19685 [Gemmatimonadaceae bacterium]|nr:hypothetical protein [Gemmatimonadaceae bacterium]
MNARIQALPVVWQSLAAVLLLLTGAGAHRLRIGESDSAVASDRRWTQAATRALDLHIDEASQLESQADSLGASSVFGAPVETASPAPEAAAPTPDSPRSLTLRGVLGGPPWLAIVAGIPGRTESRVVAEGDTVGGGRVLSVRANEVRIRRADRVDTLRFTSDWRN